MVQTTGKRVEVPQSQCDQAVLVPAQETVHVPMFHTNHKHVEVPQEFEIIDDEGFQVPSRTAVFAAFDIGGDDCDALFVGSHDLPGPPMAPCEVGLADATTSDQAFVAQGRVADGLNGGDGLIQFVETDPDSLRGNVGGDASGEVDAREELGDPPGSLPARQAPRAAASPPQAELDQAFVTQGCVADGL